MILWIPFFFLLVDSWVLSAGGAGVGVSAGCAALGSAAPELAGGLALLSDVDGAGAAEFAVGCAANEPIPGVTVSTVAVLPVPDPPVMPSVDGPPKLRVSSPVSLAGVMVGGPVRADIDTSGPVLRMPMDRCKMFGRLRASSSFCIRATATGSGCGTGIPNLVRFAFASPNS